MYSTRVKTCVVGYSIHVFLCFFTPTARELNVLATMQQPSSVVHSKLQYTQHDNTQRNRKKGRYRCLCSSKFWREIATCMHFRCQGQRVQSASHTHAMGEVSTHPIQRVGLTPDVPGHASSAQFGCRCGLESITEASSWTQAVVWRRHCWCMACSATAEAEELALLRACLCSLRRWDKVLLVCPT